jgi:phosphatidylinositol alpha-1,6-mannosyltransferase
MSSLDISNRAGSPSGTILLVANNFPPTRGGSAVVYANLARFLGSRVIVMAPKSSYSDGLPLIGWREHDRRVPYRVMRLPLLRTRIAAAATSGQFGRLLFLAYDVFIRLRVAIALLRTVAFDGVRIVCVGELLASGWIIALCRWLPQVRSVAYVHGEEITTEDGYDRGHLRARAALLDADGIIVVSRFTHRAVAQLLGPDAGSEKIQLIENGVDAQRFHNVGRRADLQNLYGLEGCKVFVSVCRLLEKKGIDNAIRAFAALPADSPPCRYLIVGTGPYEETLRAIAEECGVADRVMFSGDVTEEELVAHYSLGDVFLMPNRELPNGDTEGFGLVFLEANSCGLPVIAGRDGGSQDAVQHDVNGLVVDGGSVPAITAAMRAFLEDPALYARLCQGAATVSQAAGWQRKAAAFLAICDRLFEQR